MLVLLLLTHPPAVLEALSLHSFLTPRFWFAHGGVTELNVGINWSTMFFLTGMMVLVEGMGEAGFFDWVSLRLARALGFRPMAILLSFMILAALLAMFVDSVTVILFLVAATVRLAQYLRFDPVPLIIGEIFAANLGGAATMTGDPPNIILGTSLGLSFWDFLQNNGIICLAGLGLALVYFYVCFHNKLKRREKGVAPELWEIDPGDAIPNHRIFRVRVGLFAAVVLLIATHTLTGLTMPSIGILAAGATLCTTKYPWGLLKQVEWKTLGFLVGLFLTVSGLEQTGLLNGLAQVLAKLAGGHPVRTVVVLIMAWGIVFMTGVHKQIPDIGGRSWLFLTLSGLATGLSWLFYYRALQMGDASRVVPIDKSSVVISMILAFVILKEKLTWQSIVGGLLISAGTFVLIL